MAYAVKNYDHLLGTPGFSDDALKTHFGLYNGYVTNTNKLAEKLAEMLAAGDLATPEYAEMKRRFGWEFNGMRLHEHYFASMKNGGSELESASELAQQLGKDFVSFAGWSKDFAATGGMRGIGWAILYYDKQVGRLFNVWINEHDLGHLAGAVPVLIMDVFEHAYFLDYGAKRADYIAAFIKAIDWEAAVARFDQARS
ncbi:MAG: superoxide dismutase [Candidatus Abawacabacteria bacterium RIFCSPHIGHO2_01_FULL_46_8]|uniref:superoxide dismutase n=1 Tax=Candidatus Abawacabacteria bacterium RIFCSPHIGHO2_01_FULL_46_8 TaxID=1817815 RepID=A0A1F4XK39_9BACT|nr:MAG: superoxide dismutase [Candidatus Abawacabacteria bacterium RIFCSPHIGHO2_01_FULL_46_8]